MKDGTIMFTLSSRNHWICSPLSVVHIQKHNISRFSRQQVFNLHKKNSFSQYLERLFIKFDSFKTSDQFREKSIRIVNNWSQQLEFIAAHRLRRSFQIISSFKRWWGSFNNFNFYRFNNGCKRKLYFAAAGFVPFFDWNQNRIPQHELNSLLDELFKTKSQIDEKKGYPLPVPEPKENPFKCESSSCKCERCLHLTDDGWSLFYETTGTKIWRKEHMGHPGQGLYVYKVYGYYPDVIADDYFRVQIDTDYRKEWDKNSVQLQVVDSDRESNSDVLYWEFLFPRMFYNRDYVCNRRYEINEEKQYMAIVNESVVHPDCPERPPIHRVQEYWSHIVIRPTDGSFYKPGMEFTITYFDNPELSIPSSISVWYTVYGMPDYLLQQKLAAKRLFQLRRAQTYEPIYTTAKNKDTNESKSKDSKEVQGHSQPHNRVLLY